MGLEMTPETSEGRAEGPPRVRRASSGLMTEIHRQSQVFFDDSELDDTEDDIDVYCFFCSPY